MSSQDTCNEGHACMSCQQCQQYARLAASASPVSAAADGVCCPDSQSTVLRASRNAELWPALPYAGVIALLMSDLPFYTDPTRYPDTYLSSPSLASPPFASHRLHRCLCVFRREPSALPAHAMQPHH